MPKQAGDGIVLSLEELVRILPERHRRALQWFSEQAGHEIGWPSPLSDGTLLAGRAKGIYKPSWSKYSLSVRENRSGRYADKEPIVREDGTWVYAYAQEGEPSLANRDTIYANQGLVNCSKDRVPVGVMRQISEKPLKYRVLGVAIIAGWEGGYFFLEGFSPTGVVRDRGPQAEIKALERLATADAGYFSPNDVIDARERIIASITRRRGQTAFRDALIESYASRCAITSCDAVEALEAAHIIPYRGEATNHPTNGMLLRADVHLLFDLGLIAVDTTTMTVLVSPKLCGTSYMDLAAKQVRMPLHAGFAPSKEALNQHREWSGL